MRFNTTNLILNVSADGVKKKQTKKTGSKTISSCVNPMGDPRLFPSSYPACQQNKIVLNNNNNRVDENKIHNGFMISVSCPKSTPATSRCVSLQAYIQRGWEGFSTVYCATGTITYTGLTDRLTKHNGCAHRTLRMDEQ